MTEIKTAARKAAFETRKAAFGRGLDEAANAALISTVLAEPGAVVAAYMPIRTEISPLPAMTALHEVGRLIVVPVIRAAGQPLVFSRWQPDARMIAGPFGAEIPAEEELFDPDIVITPLLAFDRKGYRLGYGGGFYDRTFEALRKTKSAIGIGFAYSAQEVDEVPIEPTDQRLDRIVTENGVRLF